LEAYEIRAAAEYRGTFVVVGTRLVDLGPQLGAVLQPGIWASDDGKRAVWISAGEGSGGSGTASLVIYYGAQQ